ncbi:MAG TPA: alpha/beta fold hydrolase [Actinomycetota bacterium]|nr:alpha/beta fold hydrolase [Actinomycetota bacterium]
MPRPGAWPVARGFVREARGIATLAVRYPFGIRSEQVPTPAERETLGLPVVLVHGYFHNRSGFYAMRRTLTDDGFAWVHAMNYSPVRNSVASLAELLADRVEAILEVSGAPRVHVVGHSLGGLVIRWYLQELGGCDRVDHAVTIGTPHRGTYAAYGAFGETGRDMRPGSRTIERLEDGFLDCPTKFVNVYSDTDAFILPAVSAELPERETVENVLVRGIGHGSLLLEPRLIRVVSDHLATAEVSAPIAPVRRLREVTGPPSAAADASL